MDSFLNWAGSFNLKVIVLKFANYSHFLYFCVQKGRNYYECGI